MTVFITGGTGLVGSRLLRCFAEAGISCRALVRPGGQTPAGVTRVEGDLLLPESLPAALEGVTAIVHLAALFRTSDEVGIWRVNFEGTRNLIAAAKQSAPQARFIMTSTAHVYGNEMLRPGVESDPVAPTLAYPASKVAAEKELRESGLVWSILRLGFVYGDGDEHLASIPRLVPAHNLHPAQSFSMIHQRDVARAVQLALTGAMDTQIVNITDDAPTTIYEMAQVIGVTMKASDTPLSHPWMGRMDGSRLRSLGFRPTIATIYQAAEAGIL